MEACCGGSMSIVRRTVAFDEGPNPQPQPWAEYFVCAPRTTPAMAAAIRAGGTRLIIKVQPCRWLHDDGSPVLDWQWDRMLSLLPLFKDASGANVTFQPGQGMEG